MGWFFGRRKNIDSLWESMSSVSRMVEGFKREGEAVSPRRQAGIVFSHDEELPFLETLSEHLDAILYEGPGATKTGHEIKDDAHGMRWAILNDGNFGDLLSSIFTVANAIKMNGGSQNLLAAVFEFDFANHAVNPQLEAGSGYVNAYLIYRFDRNSYYPFVPTGNEAGERDRETERMLGSAVRSAGLKTENSLSEWLGLWGIPF
jgi:hypothetical protein